MNKPKRVRKLRRGSMTAELEPRDYGDTTVHIVAEDEMENRTPCIRLTLPEVRALVKWFTKVEASIKPAARKAARKR